MAPSNQEKARSMSQSHHLSPDDLPLFRFAIQTERELEDALDAWLANDGIDEGRRHVLAWTDEEEAVR